jgi:hypothetical protein
MTVLTLSFLGVFMVMVVTWLSVDLRTMSDSQRAVPVAASPLLLECSAVSLLLYIIAVLCCVVE